MTAPARRCPSRRPCASRRGSCSRVVKSIVGRSDESDAGAYGKRLFVSRSGGATYLRRHEKRTGLVRRTIPRRTQKRGISRKSLGDRAPIAEVPQRAADAAGDFKLAA